jgi:hypothetical protein
MAIWLLRLLLLCTALRADGARVPEKAASPTVATSADSATIVLQSTTRSQTAWQPIAPVGRSEPRAYQKQQLNAVKNT